MKLLTGNDLKTGFVTWWTGADWSLHIEDAADVGEAGEAILAAEEGARRVNAPYIINGEQTADGPRPAHINAVGIACDVCVPTRMSLGLPSPGNVQGYLPMPFPWPAHHHCPQEIGRAHV